MFPHNGKAATVKEKIIDIISQNKSLSAKKIYNIIKKENSISFQAVHKALTELVQKNIFKKTDREYEIDKDWVDDLHDFSERIKYSVNPSLTKSLKLHEKVSVFLTRRETTKNLAKITNNAQKGDILFGQAKTGTNYPRSFYDSLEKAINRGVNINFILPDNIDTTDFIDMLLNFNSKNVEVKKTKRDYVRLYGIVGKEIMIALPFIDDFITIHYKDKRITDYIYRIFKQDWDKAEVMT
jgi:predicted transcriptional regulator